jgi:peptide deformylase
VKIVTYPHPTLRHKSKPIRRVDRPLQDIVRKMFDLMYESRGVGLAANQVDLPLRLFVVNLQADPDEGEELVFVNPVISRPKGNDELEEGCLSFPGLQCQVKRPASVQLHAFDLQGNEMKGEINGFLARVVQHELDHLDGVLFIDRLSPTGQMAAREAIEDFELTFHGRRERGEIETDEEIRSRLSEWELKYC